MLRINICLQHLSIITTKSYDGVCQVREIVRVKEIVEKQLRQPENSGPQMTMKEFFEGNQMSGDLQVTDDSFRTCILQFYPTSFWTAPVASPSLPGLILKFHGIWRPAMFGAFSVLHDSNKAHDFHEVATPKCMQPEKYQMLLVKGLHAVYLEC